MAWRADIKPSTVTGASLEPLILRDQLFEVGRSSIIAVQFNITVSIFVAIISIHAGKSGLGMIWLASSTMVNLVRIALGSKGSTGVSDRNFASPGWSVQHQLRLFSIGSLISGLVWSFIFLLCNGYTSLSTPFDLTIICGSAAAAVANSPASARVAICFITPPLVTLAACLVTYSGSFDRSCLAVTVLLFFAILIRISLRGEARFVEFSRAKNEATMLAHSLQEANGNAIAAADQMSYRAGHDELTGLLNRAGFMQKIEVMANAIRPPVCLMILDLDGFRSINDLFGQKAGDQVLVEVARRLREALTDEIALARIGGDEFAIFYQMRPSGDPPPALARRLITAIEKPFAMFDASRVGASIGLHVTEDINIAEMLSYADEALYVAKNAGRNRYCVFDESLRNRREMNLDVERDLRHALSDAALEVWYQPVFGADGRSVVSLEALLRWKHPKHGWIRPEDMVATASMTGISGELVSFILGEVCAMIQKLLSLDLDHVWVAMNVSPREVSRLALDEIVLTRLQDLGLPAAMLEIEITEETAMNIRAVQSKLNRLSGSGIRLAVDDFGVGYSSLASLRHLHVDRIKIDRSFVTGITTSPSDQILVQTILKLGKSLGMDVVAEGVETAEDLDLLQSLGCELVQGYHLKRPASRDEIIEWLQDLNVGKTKQLQA